MSDWKLYQNKAADLFRSFGLSAAVEVPIDGIRGRHRVDVFVEGVVYGIPVRWVVECKHWQTNIPKEKAIALLGIVQDVGADRGFLLSEVGFQSGAIAATNKTNITLTSIAALRESADVASLEDAISVLRTRFFRAQVRLHDLMMVQSKRDGLEFKPYLLQILQLAAIEAPLNDADLGRRTPITFHTTNGDSGIRVAMTLTFDEFLQFARQSICDAEACANFSTTN